MKQDEFFSTSATLRKYQKLPRGCWKAAKLSFDYRESYDTHAVPIEHHPKPVLTRNSLHESRARISSDIATAETACWKPVCVPANVRPAIPNDWPDWARRFTACKPLVPNLAHVDFKRDLLPDTILSGSSLGFESAHQSVRLT